MLETSFNLADALHACRLQNSGHVWQLGNNDLLVNHFVTYQMVKLLSTLRERERSVLMTRVQPMKFHPCSSCRVQDHRSEDPKPKSLSTGSTRLDSPTHVIVTATVKRRTLAGFRPICAKLASHQSTFNPMCLSRSALEGLSELKRGLGLPTIIYRRSLTLQCGVRLLKRSLLFLVVAAAWRWPGSTVGPG